MHRRRWTALAALLLVTGCSLGGEPVAEPAAEPAVLVVGNRNPGERPVIQPAELRLADLRGAERANIVLVLLDDADYGLLATMPNATALARRGASYPNAFVVDTLCCPSRASLLTGQYPHQTGVLTNTSNLPNPHGAVGGWEAFRRNGNLERSVNVRLQDAGYTTGFVGKFLNQYEYFGEPMPVPPGWTEWHALLGDAYDGWKFSRVDNQGQVTHHPAPPADASDAEKDAAYAGAVTEELALDFIAEHGDAPAPYFLEVAPYATHSRVSLTGQYADDPVYPPAMRDRPRPGNPGGNCGLVDCDDLTLADLPGYGDDPADNAPRAADGSVLPAWRESAPVSPREAVTTLRNRVRMAQSVDRMIGKLVAAVDENTVIIVTSDNGFHIGQHSFGIGKATAYDSDVRVPLVIAGAGILPGEREELVTSLDLAPTFEAIAGLRPAAYRSGRSLLPSLRDPGLRRRDGIVIEHTWSLSLAQDPDRGWPGSIIDDVPSYVAVRGQDGLLVRLDLDNSWEGTSHGWEYYDYREAAWERTNRYGDPAVAADVRRLQRVLDRFDRCSHLTFDDVVPRSCR